MTILQRKYDEPRIAAATGSSESTQYPALQLQYQHHQDHHQTHTSLCKPNSPFPFFHKFAKINHLCKSPSSSSSSSSSSSYLLPLHLLSAPFTKLFLQDPFSRDFQIDRRTNSEIKRIQCYYHRISVNDRASICVFCRIEVCIRFRESELG
ncbi:hypothetical protein L6452_03608 [Arctium lappa]|uniref:Uncharacterized protein n=1 Tax=Arctium lappa TaxID=4217 RepID=A0ACB9FPB8_ARCLA|nr:hypothetical protein L6452_03608 [Arctium lappa]